MSGKARCEWCGCGLPFKQGVLSIPTRAKSAADRIYRPSGGPHLAGVHFADNVQVYSVSRLYRKYLDEWFPEAKGSLLDVGCGDGRLALWALERGFEHVLAVDASLPALERLVAAARKRGFDSRLLAVCCPLAGFTLPKRRFDLILCSEVLYYLGTRARKARFLRQMREALSPQGKIFLAEFMFFGRLLADAVALNVQNLRYAAERGTRLEKFGRAGGDTSQVEISHPTLAELEAQCHAAGLRILARKGISPISMLFQHGFTFTSYPRRPRLDRKLQRILDRLEDDCAEASDLSRNAVLLLGI